MGGEGELQRDLTLPVFALPKGRVVHVIFWVCRFGPGLVGGRALGVEELCLWVGGRAVG